MQWQARVRQAFKRKEIEMALLEFSSHQKKSEGKDQEKKLKRSKTKKDHEGIDQLDGVSDEENDL
jgi:hypothetical protein